MLFINIDQLLLDGLYSVDGALSLILFPFNSLLVIPALNLSFTEFFSGC